VDNKVPSWSSVISAKGNSAFHASKVQRERKWGESTYARTAGEKQNV